MGLTLNDLLQPVWGALDMRIQSCPNALAILATPGEPAGSGFTFQQLGRMFGDIDTALQSAGVARGDTVALIQADGPGGLISLLGAGRATAACPLDPALSAVELERDLLQLGASAAIVNDKFGVAATVAAKLGLALIEARSEAEGFAWHVVSRPASRAHRPADGTMLLLHTSATSGPRKLVALTHENVAAMLSATLSVTHLGANDRALLLARLFHIQGVLTVLAQLSVGGSVIAPLRLAPEHVYDLLQTLQPTWYTCGPVMHHALLHEIKQREAGIRAPLRFVRSAGLTLTPALSTEIARTLGVPVLNVYGLSETGGAASTRLDEPAPEGSVGRSMGIDIASMSPDGRLLGQGEEGEIVLRGPAIMRAYLDPVEANREAFTNGWFRTGDSGYVDSNGFLFLRGRLKEIINRGGEKISPDETDAVLAQHPDVREVASFGLPHPTLGEVVASAVVLHEGAATTPAELRRFAQPHLAAYKLPRQIFFRSRIPRGSTGKPQRLALRDEYAAWCTRVESGANIEGLAVLEEHQEVVRLWSSLLGCDSIGRDDDFFALGGDSLSAITMLSGLDALFGFSVPLSPERFLECPTIGGLMDMLNQADGPLISPEGNGIVHPLRTGGGRGTIYLLPANESRGLYLRRMARHISAEWSASLVRPSDRGPYRPFYAIEQSAAEVVKAVRATQPSGPYILAGYCQGGVIAFEAAMRLEHFGERVLLVLFDTPVPGGSHIVQQWQVYNTNAREKLKAVRRSASLMPLLRSVRALARRAIWLSLRRGRAVANLFWGFRWMRQLTAWCTRKDFAFYRPQRGSMPILHFLAEEEEGLSRMRAASRLGWERRTAQAVQHETVPGDHESIFEETNLPGICRLMEEWLEEQLNGDRVGAHPGPGVMQER